MADADDVVVELVRGLVKSVPVFGSWLASVLDGDDDPAVTRRVREVLPAKSASRQAVEDLGADDTELVQGYLDRGEAIPPREGGYTIRRTLIVRR